MKALLIASVGAGIALLVPGPARAQLEPELQTGSMIPVKPKPVDAERAGRIRKGFARCIFRKATPKVNALLANSDQQSVDLVGAKITRVAVDLGMEECLSNEVGVDQSALGMKFPPSDLRDLMAEEAYLAANRVAPKAPAAPVPPLQAKYVSTGDALVKAQAMSFFTDCTVLKDVGHADALLRTMPGSGTEREAARSLAPALGECLMKGQQVALSPASIRAFIAYAMWNRFGRGATQ